MSDVSIRHLEYLVAVADTGSVSRAAALVHASPGTLSQGLTALERSLGVQLLYRRAAKGSQLTPAGIHAIPLARAVLAESEKLTNLGAFMAGELFGAVRVGCYTTISPWVVPHLVDRFTTEHPAASVQFDDAFRADMLEDVLIGKLDALITFGRHVGDAHARHVHRTVVARAPLVAMVAQGHPLASHDSLSLERLAREPAIPLDSSPHVDLVTEYMTAEHLTPLVAHRSRHFDTVQSLVARGYGYSLTMGMPHAGHSMEGLPLTYVQIGRAHV